MRVNSSSSNTRARHNSRPRASTSLSPRIRSLRFSRVNSWRPRAYKTQPGIPFLSPSLVLHHCHYRIFTAVSVAGLREREERKGRKKKKKKKKEAFATVNPQHGRLTSSSDDRTVGESSAYNGRPTEEKLHGESQCTRERQPIIRTVDHGDAEVGPNCKISCARDRRSD